MTPQEQVELLTKLSKQSPQPDDDGSYKGFVERMQGAGNTALQVANDTGANPDLVFARNNTLQELPNGSAGADREALYEDADYAARLVGVLAMDLGEALPQATLKGQPVRGFS